MSKIDIPIASIPITPGLAAPEKIEVFCQQVTAELRQDVPCFGLLSLIARDEHEAELWAPGAFSILIRFTDTLDLLDKFQVAADCFLSGSLSLAGSLNQPPGD